MSIETVDLDLDQLPPAKLAAQVARLEKSSAPLATLAASPEHVVYLRDALMALRASGISPLLTLRRGSETHDRETLLQFFALLRDWDQLLLRNMLELIGDRVPEKFRPNLAFEARTEAKWFQEWLTAVSDPRIHRYPGLPWRSFLRKVNAENFDFARALLSDEPLEERVTQFLIAKKKTICIFPKNWNKK